MTLNVRLICHSQQPHIQQVYTGLSMLHRSGLVNLNQQIATDRPGRAGAPQHLRDARATHTRLVIEETLTVHYDMHDSQDIDLQDLDDCDYYFKRSFSSAYVSSLPRGAGKVRPYGLNYHVLPDFMDTFAARRAWGLLNRPSDRVHALREALDAGNKLSFHPRVRELESLPDYDLPARVLFLVTAYDPHDNADRNSQKIAERIETNEMRAECIRLLRRELGPSFLGGFNHNAYTVARYKDCLVSDTTITEKKIYLRTVKSHPICVATTGLHSSIGWKFAEYVACARAILTERPMYEVPGGLAPGKNYIEFSSAADCVEQALRLVDNQELRSMLMTANAIYYRAHLRPDSLVLNSLLAALSKADF